MDSSTQQMQANGKLPLGEVWVEAFQGRGWTRTHGETHSTLA